MLKANDQSQHISPASQSEHIVLSDKEETGNKHNVTEKQGTEVLQHFKLCEN